MAKRSLIDQLDQAITQLLARPDAPIADVNPEIAPLVRIAGELRNLPRTAFMERLKSDLERSTAMATTTETIAAVRTVAAPRIAFKDTAKAIEFYKAAFGATETMRFELEGHIPHAEITIGDSVIMLADEWPEGGRFSAETLGQSPVAIQLTVPDVDALVERAVAAGAKVTIPVRDQFYGHREGTVVDPFGYTWGISTVTEEMSVEEMHRRLQAEQSEQPRPAVDPIPKGYRTVTPYPVVQDAAGLIDFVKHAFGAEESFRSVGSAGGIHAEVRIGDSMLMMGGGGPGLAWRGESKPLAFHIYVPDCDATYQRALQAGGTSLDKPADQFYGERSATVQDAAGNHWYIATYKGDNYKWEGAPDIQPVLHPLRSEPVINFLKRAFGALELGRHTTPEGVIQHTTLKVGDSHLELGDAHGPYQPMPGMYYLYVLDCDAVYRRALAAGGTSVAEPADQPYGDRSGAVKDAFGNEWWIATHIKDVAV
ncbi:MAG TPA: VOC family protein [Candidatus Eisenbacteria bacterium]|nr:VOC family protein [Candidatus Eisenbacteria bacterium]